MSLWAVVQSLERVLRVVEAEEAIESLLLQLELGYREFLVKHTLLSLDGEALTHIVAAVKILDT